MTGVSRSNFSAAVFILRHGKAKVQMKYMKPLILMHTEKVAEFIKKDFKYKVRSLYNFKDLEFHSHSSVLAVCHTSLTPRLVNTLKEHNHNINNCNLVFTTHISKMANIKWLPITQVV